jgi:hypothetical protein
MEARLNEVLCMLIVVAVIQVLHLKLFVWVQIPYLRHQLLMGMLAVFVLTAAIVVAKNMPVDVVFIASDVKTQHALNVYLRCVIKSQLFTGISWK